MSEAVATESNLEVNQAVSAEPAPSTAPAVRICLHIKDDGLRCGTPAVTGRQFCYFHCRAHHPGARIATRRYRAPIPESVASLQIALAHALQALGSGDITPKQANSMMYGINLGTNLVRLGKPLSDAEKQQVATEIPPEIEQVLAGPANEAEDETRTPFVPESRQQALLILEREISRLRAYLLPPDQMSMYEEHVRTLKNTSDPRYYTACTKISHHDYGMEQLRKMGLR